MINRLINHRLINPEFQLLSSFSKSLRHGKISGISRNLVLVRQAALRTYMMALFQHNSLQQTYCRKMRIHAFFNLLVNIFLKQKSVLVRYGVELINVSSQSPVNLTYVFEVIFQRTLFLPNNCPRAYVNRLVQCLYQKRIQASQ